MITATTGRPKAKRGAIDGAINRLTSIEQQAAGPPAAKLQPGDNERTEIALIPIGEIDRHPDNRVIDESDPSIVELASSIAQHGQLEPMRVRRMGSGRYQLISGERRYTALIAAGMIFARCIVVECDDATALIEVAVANSHRQDLNAIERAQHMVKLMMPKDKGGSGLTREQAGLIFGLTSESGCKNALRMLKLPKELQGLIISGDLPERAARALIPYCEVPEIEKELINIFRLAKQDGTVATRAAGIMEGAGEELYEIEGLIHEHLRPIDLDVTRRYDYPISLQPRLFEIDDATRERLQCVTLPTHLGWNPKLRRDEYAPRVYARNVKLWDELQQPHIDAIAEGKSKENGKKSPAKSVDGTPKKLTPAQQRAEDARKAKEADERLDKFTRDWAFRLMRATISTAQFDEQTLMLMMPLITTCGYDGQSDLRSYADAALHEAGLIQKPFEPWSGRGDSQVDLAKHRTKGFAYCSAFWRCIVWPVSHRVGSNKVDDALVTAGELPDKIRSIDDDEVRELAELVCVSAETAWQAGATEDSDERRLIAVWLLRHTTKQLASLAEELGVKAFLGDGRSAIAEQILAQHRPGKPLRLPKRIDSILNPSKGPKNGKRKSK